MNIQDRLRHCAKHTGLDAVVELLNEAAAHIEGLNSIPKVQGGEPVPFLLNGTRFKMSFQTDLDADLDPITTLTCFNNFQNQLDGRWVALVAAEDDVHLKLRTAQPAQATQAEVNDDVIAVTAANSGFSPMLVATDGGAFIRFARAILALRPQQSGLTGCNCRWDGDTQVQWCELHLAHKEAIHEWAERAKEAEKKLALRPAAVPMTCHCQTCRPITITDMRMVLCPKCGNKRCPHANDHRNACTGSNEPGQPGSAYPAPHGITAQADLWCIHIPGPDEVHAAPSKEAADHMAAKHNAAMATFYSSGAPNLEFAPSIENVQAVAIKWPYDQQSHADELREFDWSGWGLTKKDDK